ncbi:hypothetical protein [Streptomyces sp. NPDC018038]|uniref:hypothetical protein n=1 Tax=Streptomyces sp. NPDC018038 TaxID=3365036 RepID=UPI00378E2B9A
MRGARGPWKKGRPEATPNGLPPRTLRSSSLSRTRRERSAAGLTRQLGVTSRTVRRDSDRLREGSSDVAVLEPALTLLYPHLTDVVRFMNYAGNAQGGTGALVTTVRAFCAAHIANPVIALIDNDTAATDALRPLLRDGELPSSIKVLRYPPIELATRYPTLGPPTAEDPAGRISAADVNGLAGSIELYLGRDVLTGTDGTLRPVQWTSYMKGSRQYQGEVVDKREIQTAYRAKLAKAQSDPNAPCALCAVTAPVYARWPLGPVCKSCYRTARSHPGQRPACNRQRVLIGREDERRICGPCSGNPHLYACPRCTNPLSYMVRGLCDRYTLQDQLATVFDIAPAEASGQYHQMRTALAECEQPRTALNWLRNSHSARMLTGLVAVGQPLTHEVLDTIAHASGRGGTQTIDYLRTTLVTYQVLPERDELTARIERHLTRTAARHPEHALLLRAYVRWSLLPRARRADRRPGGFKHRVRWAYTRINLAVAFLTTMNDHGLALAEVTQHEMDRWLADHPGTRYEVRTSWSGPHAEATAVTSISRTGPRPTPSDSTRTPTGSSSTSA